MWLRRCWPRCRRPNQVESRLGLLEFTDGAPVRKTVEALYDHLDFLHGVNAFLTAFPGASTQAMHQGFREIGVEDNSVLIFSRADGLVVAVPDRQRRHRLLPVSFIDLSDGPMVVETPPTALGTIDDMWFHWIIDFGLPGPDRGAGGKFVLVPPGYDGPLPEGGFYVGHSRTNRALLLGRSFIQDDDPAPTVATIKSTLKIYPYTPGGPGTSVATLLQGRGAVHAARRGAGHDVRRGHRHGVQHDPADRCPVLRDRPRPVAGGAGRRR